MSQDHGPRYSSSGVSRRAALGGIGAAVAVGLTRADRAVAQNTGDLANHPLVGTWAVMTEGGIVPQTHGADGSFIAAYPPNYVDPATGLTFQGPGLGRWEPVSERGGRFSLLQALADAEGAYIGSAQLAAEIEASEDGQSWHDTGGGPHIVVRDAANTVVFDQVVSTPTLVSALRIGATIESLTIPAAPPAGTPEP